VSSTPPPPAYTKIVDMTGNRTFQTGGITYLAGSSGFSNGTTQAFGSGTTVAYNAANDSYTLTAPDGATQTFGVADRQIEVGANGVPPSPNSLFYSKFIGNTGHKFTLVAPGGSVPLSYTVIGTWSTKEEEELGTVIIGASTKLATVRIAVGGSPTFSSDMPKTGTANYTMGVGGSAISSGDSYNLSGSSSGTFSANFATGGITTTLTLAGQPAFSGSQINLGTFNGTGTIASGGPGYSGTLSGNGATGVFSGAFFGPQALETGFAYMLAAPNFSAVGAASGVKQ
jgi:hypothetical protein